jgi:hypothetical protein
MVESQNAHRIGIEKNTISSQQHREGMGQWMAFAIAIGGIGAALYAALNGQAWFGGTLCAECLTSLVYAFVVSKKSRDDDFEKKRPPPPEKPGSPPSV